MLQADCQIFRFCHSMNNRAFNDILGREIKRVREEKGITQEELASRMNVNSQNISSYERGERCPSLFWMNRLYDALDIQPANFTEELYQKLNTELISPNVTVIKPVSKEINNPLTTELDSLSEEIEI
ncbi:MAG: Helix-turn-helix domain [Fluviicola sp.]|nr:Helix-turn-helix domain [Fluviicola sp.]